MYAMVTDRRLIPDFVPTYLPNGDVCVCVCLIDWGWLLAWQSLVLHVVRNLGSAINDDTSQESIGSGA
jgi:hypothetical protein